MRTHVRHLCNAHAVCVAVALLVTSAGQWAWPEALPYNLHDPVIYDNDGAIESGFTDVYVMALASAGVIQLRGIVTTCSYGEEKRQPPFSPIPNNDLIRERQELIEKARRSGLRNLPDATAGCSLSLKRPVSGRIKDTPTYDTAGSRLILAEARKATPARPLVVLMGGQATTVVDAYLLDPSIRDRMVLAWVVGNKTPGGGINSREYNAAVDPWATYIAFQKLRVVAFPFTNDGNNTNDGFAATPKARLSELPDTELRQTMQDARWPRSATTFSEPSFDCDAMPAFPMTRPDYVQLTKRFTFSRWYDEPGSRKPARKLPAFKEDPHGNALVVWSSSSAVATQEWWRRMKDPAVWGHVVRYQAPYGGTPWAVPGLIEAAYFDDGGEGRAYHDTTNNLTKAKWFNPIRFLENVDILKSATASGGYKVGRTASGEWIEYTVRVRREDTYRLMVRVASAGPGGIFHIEFDGIDQTGPLAVPDTGGWEKWRVVSRPHIRLHAGVHVMRLVIDRAGPTGSAGDFDNIRLASSDSAP